MLDVANIIFYYKIKSINEKDGKMELTNSQEEYLKTIYILKNTKNEIKVTEIANKLNKTKASVNNAINSLKQEGLIYYEPYGQIELTKQGEALAQKIIEANDIVKLFLTEIINATEENAENEAKSIKTVLSDDTLNKLARYTHKELGLTSLDCGYDINNQRCIVCARRKESKK